MVQLFDPWLAGGANVPCLANAQVTYAACGAMEERFLGSVKGVLPGDVRDSDWRPVTAADVSPSENTRPGELRDLSLVYYWRRNAA